MLRVIKKDKLCMTNSNFCKIGKAKMKKKKRKQNTWLHVSEICAEVIFCVFSWWLKNVNNRSKLNIFWNRRHFEIEFPKKKIMTFFWRTLSNQKKKKEGNKNNQRAHLNPLNLLVMSYWYLFYLRSEHICSSGKNVVGVVPWIEV